MSRFAAIGACWFSGNSSKAFSTCTSAGRISVSTDSALMPGSNTPNPPGIENPLLAGMPVVHVFLPDDPPARELARAQPVARSVDTRGEARMPGLEQRSADARVPRPPAARSGAWSRPAAFPASRACRRATRSTPRRSAPVAACRWKRSRVRARAASMAARSGKFATPSTVRCGSRRPRVRSAAFAFSAGMCWSRAILPMPSRPIFNAISSPRFVNQRPRIALRKSAAGVSSFPFRKSNSVAFSQCEPVPQRVAQLVETQAGSQ